MVADKAEFIDIVLFFLDRPVLHPRNRLIVHASILTNVRRGLRLSRSDAPSRIINAKILLSIKRFHRVAEAISSVIDEKVGGYLMEQYRIDNTARIR